MRLSLIDQIISTALCGLGAGCATALFRLWGVPRGEAFLPSLAFGVLAVIGLAPLIYRRLGLFPLWLPKCPECRQIPHGYQVLEVKGHCFLLRCPVCAKCLEAWTYEDPEHGEGSGLDVPAYRLCWPEFIGIWKPVKQTTPKRRQAR